LAEGPDMFVLGAIAPGGNMNLTFCPLGKDFGWLDGIGSLWLKDSTTWVGEIIMP
jgi:hypothetical protein